LTLAQLAIGSRGPETREKVMVKAPPPPTVGSAS
jgi:hypothetical protein